ncbi:MAG: DNA topoisomerase IV [Verrucomicrobiales bacterium]|nr:DNA topoisomerase IV [Verrucomicrobiales bacterium]
MATKKKPKQKATSFREKKPKEKLVLPEEKGPLHVRMDNSFLEYASYVIRDRAIPKVDDGLKPVQRRILWALNEKDDGKFIKVANVVGHTMQYHPHGDASIGDALVNLVNKRYLIEGQGNFGNIYTGDPAAAPRYIECRLTELARNEIFNDEVTEFVPSYDGRNKEPVALPAKLPLLLMLGTEGIAVGMSSKILPHNFCELIEAQIAILRKESFRVVPDFMTGGLMDAKDYKDGKGSIRVRAKIKVKDSSTLVITELPPHTTSESLIASIEDASRKGKIKIKSIDDFTAGKVEIQIKTPSGVEAEQLVDALYAFTNCEASLSSRITVIRKNRPAEMTVSEVLKENTARLVEILKQELELKLAKLEKELHFKTLIQLFVENRIYKRIEECTSNDAIYKQIYAGFKPLRRRMFRDLVDDDIEMLLGVRIRRISLFDIKKHKEEIKKVKAEIEETKKNLKSLTKYVIRHLKDLLEKYGKAYPRKTKRARFDEVVARDVAFKAFKVTYDRKRGYVGYKVNGDEFPVACTQYDKIVLVSKTGSYKVIQIEEKYFAGSDLVHCEHPDRDSVFTMVYQTKDACYLKRFTFGGTIMNKEYSLVPEKKKAKIVYFERGTPEELFVRYKPMPKQKINQQTCKPKLLAVKGAKARGKQMSPKSISNIGAKPPKNWDPDATTTEIPLGI